jgi:hypothetical protein
MNFQLVGWVDPHDLIASLRSRMPLFTGTGIRHLPLRGPKKNGDPNDDSAFVDRRTGPAGRWPEMHTILRTILDARPGLLPGRIYLELLDPGAAAPLRQDTRPYCLRHLRLLVGVRCPPQAYLWSPPEPWLMQPGQVVLTRPSLWHAAINLAATPRITLVIDLRDVIGMPAQEAEAIGVTEKQDAI